MLYLNEEANNGSDIVSLFKSYFSTMYKNNQVCGFTPHYYESALNTISVVHLEKNLILYELWYIKLNNLPGTNEIFPFFFK